MEPVPYIEDDLPVLPGMMFLFVREYLKDFNAPRAAERAGYSSPARGNELLQREDVQSAVRWFLQDLRQDAAINAEWVMWEAVDNHKLARQQGNLSASNAALKLIGQLADVDAFAAEKMELSGEVSLVDRLTRGRERARLVEGTDSASSPEAFEGATTPQGQGQSSTQRPHSGPELASEARKQGHSADIGNAERTQAAESLSGNAAKSNTCENSDRPGGDPPNGGPGRINKGGLFPETLQQNQPVNTVTRPPVENDDPTPRQKGPKVADESGRDISGSSHQETGTSSTPSFL